MTTIVAFVAEAVAPVRDRSRVEQSLKFEDNIGLVHLQAKVGHRMCAAAGLDVDYDDVFQEASLAFVLAARGFNPDLDIKFSAYFTKAAFSAFRKMIGLQTGVKNLNEGQRAEIMDRRETNKKRGQKGLKPLPDMQYGIRPVSFADLSVEESEGDPWIENVAGESQTPEEIIEARQEWQQATANLTPLAQLVVDWLRSPPPELVRELDCQEAYADAVKACGLRSPRGSREGLSIDTVGKFLKLIAPTVTGEELFLVKRELMEVVNKLGD